MMRGSRYPDSSYYFITEGFKPPWPLKAGNDCRLPNSVGIEYTVTSKAASVDLTESQGQVTSGACPGVGQQWLLMASS